MRRSGFLRIWKSLQSREPATRFPKEFPLVRILFSFPLGLDHIYQAKRYKELFGARCAFLITAERIPARLRRLCIALPQILHASNDAYSFFVLAEFKRDPSEPSNGAFVDWFPADPFANSVYWR